RVVPASLVSAAVVAAVPKSAAEDGPAVFGKLNTPVKGTPLTEQVDIEAADMRMLGELAAHLATMPKGADGALDILTVAAASEVDPGGAALSLARALSGAGRKAIVVDAGSGSREF